MTLPITSRQIAIAIAVVGAAIATPVSAQSIEEVEANTQTLVPVQVEQVKPGAPNIVSMQDVAMVSQAPAAFAAPFRNFSIEAGAGRDVNVGANLTQQFDQAPESATNQFSIIQPASSMHSFGLEKIQSPVAFSNPENPRFDIGQNVELQPRIPFKKSSGNTFDETYVAAGSIEPNQDLDVGYETSGAVTGLSIRF